MALRYNANFSVTRVVKKIAYAILALYVGGTIVDVLGTIMNKTESSFYHGFELIGWTVGRYPYNSTSQSLTCNSVPVEGTLSWPVSTTPVGSNCITDVSGSGVLAVVGIIAVASVALEFISFS